MSLGDSRSRREALTRASGIVSEARRVPIGDKSLLEGAYNFRDLGGLPTDDGRRTRRGVVFRSDMLDQITPDDGAVLRDSLGIRCVIDLRTPEEVTAADGPGVLGGLGVTRLKLPVRWPRFQRTPRGGGDVLAGRYFDYLELSADSVVAALEALSRVVPSPTVLHCTSGKDRTGVVTALLLRLLGVTEDAVVADYVATAPNIPRLLERLTGSRHHHADLDIPPEIYLAEEATMRTFLAEFEGRFGGAAAWARARGLSPEAIVRLEDLLLEPASPSEKG